MPQKKQKKTVSNPKLKTARDVIQRLRWNPENERFQMDQVVVGYKDFRYKRGCAEWELSTFRFVKEGGNIPEHAIEYIRDDTKFLWKKAERYDLVFHSGRTGRIVERSGEILWNGKLPKKKKKYRKSHDPPDSSDSENEIDADEDDGVEDEDEFLAEDVDPLVALAEEPTFVEFVVGMTVQSNDGRIGTLQRFIHKTNRWRIKGADGEIFKVPSDELTMYKPEVKPESPAEVDSGSEKSFTRRKRKASSELIDFRKPYKFKKAQRDQLAETIRIFEEGVYWLGEREFNISEEVQFSIQNSQFIPANGFKKSKLKPLGNPTRFLHVNHSVLQCVAWFARQGISNAFVLNFASAKNIGGGWRNGALAQEEAICRCSALDPCLSRFEAEYYEPHRAEGNPLYSHRMIYSPKVPVFRNDFMEVHKPLYCSVLTSPAPNKKHFMKVQNYRPGASGKVEKAMYERCRRVLFNAARLGHHELVLGAFGCGVFGHDRFDVGAIWAELFNTEFKDVFDTVVFAHLTWSEQEWIGFRDGLETCLVIEEIEFRTVDVEPWTRIEWGNPQKWKGKSKYSSKAEKESSPKSEKGNALETEKEKDFPQRRKRKKQKGKRGRKY